MLYGTSTGIAYGWTSTAYDERAGLWSIDIDTETVTRLYAGNETTWNESYVFRPNGLWFKMCYVDPSVMWMLIFMPVD